MTIAIENSKELVLEKANDFYPVDLETSLGELYGVPTYFMHYGNDAESGSSKLVGVNVDGAVWFRDDIVALMGSTFVDEFEAETATAEFGAYIEEAPFMGAVL